MNRWTKLVLGLGLSALAWTANAKDFSSWKKFSQGELISETENFTPGAVGVLGFKIKLAPTWHTYWLNPGDSGTPIHFKFKTSAGARVERILFPLPERQQNGPLISFVYSNEVLLPIEISLAKSMHVGDKVNVQVDAEWLVCEDVCIPAFDHFQKNIPLVELKNVRPSADFDAFQKARRLVPTILSEYPRFTFKGSTVDLDLPEKSKGEQFVDFFPFKTSGVTNTKAQIESGILHFEKANVAPASDKRVGVLLTRSAENDDLKAVQFGDAGWSFESESEAPGSSLLIMLASAFLGGLILNLMPCVFPILSIKLLSLLKLAQAHPGEVRKQNLAYTAGVLFSFLGIALTLSGLRSAGHLIGWGFQLQSPVFLVILVWLFFSLSLNLLGVFEFEFASAGVGQKLTRIEGLWGSFFTGVLAVIVASPCTAPFMGVALGFGLGQPTLVLMAVFLCLGLGLAFPYLFFVIVPSAAKLLPRPGAWMNVVKQVMAVPLLLTTLWLIWILDQVRGPSAVSVALFGCVAVGLAVWVSARMRKIAQLAAMAVLLLGATYIYRSERNLEAPSDTQGLWQAFSEARVSSLKGQNVFVNMTADWCLTCKVNERLVFDDPEVQNLLRTKNVKWLRGDWTERNEEITRFLNRYDRVGVPFYVLYSAADPMGTPLPEVLTKSGFISYINKEFP